MNPPANKRRGLIAGGNWLVDHVKLIDSWPPQDGLVNILAQSAGNGGGPYNVLKALARMRAPFPLEAIGLVGDDENGRTIRADCEAHGIDARQLRSHPTAPTSYTDVMTVRGTGRRTFFHNRGANALLAPEHFDFTTTQAKVLYVGYALLLDALDAFDAAGVPHLAGVLRRARATGLVTALDCVSENSDRFRPVVLPLLPQVDVLFCNDFEAEKLTGRELGRGEALDNAAVAAAGRDLIGAGVGRWVILHYPEGACAIGRDGTVQFQGSVRMPAELVVGAVGAGDAFGAGVLFGLHENWPVARCLELGVCAAAASLRHASCSESIAPVAECLALGAAHGYR